MFDIETVDLTSAKEFIDFILAYQPGNNAIYRGLSDAKYELRPTAGRCNLEAWYALSKTDEQLYASLRRFDVDSMTIEEFMVLRQFCREMDQQGLPLPPIAPQTFEVLTSSFGDSVVHRNGYVFNELHAWPSPT